MRDQAKNGNLPHGLLFFGNEYVGKKTYAVELARIREWSGEEKQNTALTDTLVINGQSSGIDHIRTIKDWVNKKPINSTGQTVIIDNAHGLSYQAVNALLKTLEEPHEGSVIMLITHDIIAIPETIISRVHAYHFAPVTRDAIQNMLENDYGIPKKDTQKYAQKSWGLPGLAWRMACDQAFQSTQQLARKFLDSNVSPTQKKDIIKTIAEDETFDLALFLRTCMITMAQQNTENAIPSSLWRYIIKLTSQSEKYNLSNKIQLTALQHHIHNVVPKDIF
jgi:replication-associated recombination protein RarA